MERNEKKSLYSVIYLILITLLLVSIPFGLFIKNELILFIINFIIRVSCIIYSIIYIKKENLNKINYQKINNKTLILLPFLLLPFSNLFVVIFNNHPMLDDLNYLKLFTDVLLTLTIAVLEEITFRSQLLPEVCKHKNLFNSIILSSVIFGSVHLLNINSLASIPYILAQVIYASLLGFVLSIVYIISKNIILAVIFHIIFNVLNQVLIENLFIINWDLSFFIINIFIGILILTYGIFCFRINNRRDL